MDATQRGARGAACHPTASWVKVGSQDWKKDHRWQSDKAQAETYIVQASAVGGPACHSGAAHAGAISC